MPFNLNCSCGSIGWAADELSNNDDDEEERDNDDTAATTAVGDGAGGPGRVCCSGHSK